MSTKPKAPHAVALVVDPGFGDRVTPLAARMHVWLVESDENHAAAERFWAAEKLAPRRADPLSQGISTFQGQGATSEEVAIAALDLVSEHHNEFSHDPPMSILEVYGTPLTQELEEALIDYGLYEIQEADGHVVALTAK